MGECQAGLHAQPLVSEMRHARKTARPYRVAGGLGSRQREQFAQVVGGCRQRADQHLRRRANLRDGFEILQRIVFRILEDQRIDVERVVRPQKRVAVGLRGENDLRADDAGGARAVVDDESLSERRSQLLRDDAGREVDAATGCIGCDDAHRAGRIFGGRAQGCDNQSDDADQRACRSKRECLHRRGPLCVFATVPDSTGRAGERQSRASGKWLCQALSRIKCTA